MKVLLYTLGYVCALGMLLSCSSKDNGSRKPEARSLYEKSFQLTTLYTDSLIAARDSAEVERLSKAYSDALTELNYSFPADIDLEISEGENDTLKNVVLRYAVLRDSLLYSFAHPVEVTDSVESISE